MNKNETEFVIIGNERCLVGDKVIKNNIKSNFLWHQLYKDDIFVIEKINSDNNVTITNSIITQCINVNNLIKYDKDKFSVGETVMFNKESKYKNQLCVINEILKDEEVILKVNDGTKIKGKLSDIKKQKYNIPSLNSLELKYYVQKNNDGKYLGRFDNYVDKLEESKIFSYIFMPVNYIEITENELMIIKKDIINKFEIFLDNTLLLKEYKFNNSNNTYNLISSDIILFKDEMKKLLLSRMNIILNEPNNFNVKDCTLNLLSSFKLDIICDYIRRVII